MKTCNISFLSVAGKMTLMAYDSAQEHSIVVSEIVSRLASVIFLSSAAALDILTHSLFILPTFIYSIGKSVYQWKIDFVLPWHHIQRVRNSVAPLILGSALGILHPYTGIAVSEPTDKYTALGVLTSNTKERFKTPCSPVHSISIVADLAKNNRYVEKNREKKEIFSNEHIKILKDAKNFEKSLEILQAQEYLHRIININRLVMDKVKNGIESSNFNVINKIILTKISGLLIPLLASIDFAISLIVQAFFLTTGAVRIISGRGPIYTEITTNPLMHVSFLIQNILKSTGNILGALVWFISPNIGLKVSHFLPYIFFQMQFKLLMLQIKIKMYFAKENTCFVLPIVSENEKPSIPSFPSQNMHKTYFIVEKKNNIFNLYWVNRPDVSLVKNLDSKTALQQIQFMLNRRFPSINTETFFNKNLSSLPSSENYARIAPQGNSFNCVVSNLFGMLEVIDKINSEDPEITKLRNTIVRKSLMKNYEFYEKEFFPFNYSNNYSLSGCWDSFKRVPDAAI